MPRPLSSLLFLVLVLFCCAATHAQSSDDKYRQLVKLAQKAPVIKFNSADSFNKLVADPGRNYSFIVLFTATNPRYKCGPCGAQAEEYQRFGTSYEAFFGDYLHSAEFHEHPFFLGMLEPDNCLDVFQAFQFTTVPHMAFIPAGKQKVVKIREDHFMRNPQASLPEIIEFVRKHTGVEVPEYHTLQEKLAPIVSGAVVAVLLSLVIRKFKRSFYSPTLWYLLALATYMIVMGGVVYNRIRNPPFMDFRDGRAQLIAPSPRTQYVAEGMIIAVVLGGAGVLFVILGDLVPRLQGGWKRVAFWICAVLLFMSLATLNNIYRMKYGSAAFRLNWRFF